ncbi:hypothetical protein D3C81_1675870 [compost metagenome]
MGLDPLDAGEALDLGAHLAEPGHVRRLDQYDHVGLATDPAALAYLGEAAQALDVLLAAAVLVEQLEIGLDPGTGRVAHLGVIALDHPALLQLAHPLAHRGTRQIDHAGDLADGGARILAQQSDDLAIELVHAGISTTGSLTGNGGDVPGKHGGSPAAPGRADAYDGASTKACEHTP